MKDETSKSEQLVGPVEELSDLQWARIERGMWQRLDAAEAGDGEERREAGDAGALREAVAQRRGGRRPWKIAAAAAVVLAAAAIALAVWPRGATQVAIIEAPREGEPARVVTSDSATTVSFADAAIEVQPNSAVLMSGTAERGATVVLERGRAGFQVAPREHRRPFVVMAGHALVRVVGTRFEVARSGEAVSVKVKEGIVDVRFLGELHQVTAGQEWNSQATSQLERSVIDGGVDGPEGGEGAERAESPEGARGAAGKGKRKPVKPPAKNDDSAELARDQAAAQAAARARAEEFTAAAELESSAPQQALQKYLELAKQQDRWAQNALYAAARLALDVGQRERAMTLARAYLRRFPAGSNAADARALLDALP